ncbi:MAG TPA: translocation/assembly module TamB domain-containing protein, partial [Acidobacteriaceae bacterium]
MQTLFDARIGHLAITRGHIRLADHTVPLDLDAHDADLRLNWVPGVANSLGVPRPGTDSYRISLSLADLSFVQGPAHALGKEKPVSSRIEASVLLYRNWARLDSFTLRALDRTLALRGQLNNFSHPEWHAEAEGDIDLSLLAPYTGFAFVRSGIVRLEGTGKGSGSTFTAAGNLKSDAIHYQDDVVDVQTAGFSARFKADRKQLVVADVRTKLARGGEVDGELLLDNWLDNTPEPTQQLAFRREHKSWPVPTGEVKAHLTNVSLDTILALLASPQYQHLGLDSLVSGPAMARWSGFANDLEIGGQLGMQASSVTPAKEVPVHGSVDATYHAATGSIDVRALNANLPHSAVNGNGLLGVYPISRASAMNLDLASSDLTEFDAVLRALEFKQGNRLGAAALPVSVKGQASFHGQFSGNWLTPHVDGHLSASALDLQSGVAPTDPTKPLPFVHWDSLDLDGLYTPASINVRHALLRRGSASITLAGRLDASDPAFDLSWDDPEFDGNATLGLKISAQQFPLTDLLPLAGVQAPITGRLNAQVELRGALNNITGAGSIDLDQATVYGESIDHIHAAGSAANQQIHIASFTAQQSSAGGRINATGSYDLRNTTFTLDAKGSSIDLGELKTTRQLRVPLAARLSFAATGGGPLRDPHLQAHATVGGITIAGQSVADLAINASTQNRSVIYDLTSHQPTGQFSAHGLTRLDADLQTKASVAFSRFDLGGLLQLFKVKGLTGQSDLEGTAALTGPLAHPEKLSGEATLNQLAVLVEGVHLRSKAPMHASLANGVTRLDPVEITGEDTDLKINGALGITGAHLLNLQASGAVNLRLAASLDPDLTASGATSFTVEAHGPLADPSLQGKVQFQNAALALQDFPNGLSQIQGTLEFMQNRLEVRSLTAMSGGGQLKVGGYLTFQHGLYADLNVTGKSIRIRYPQGVSSLADATLRLQGPQNNLLLSGNVLVTRFAINSDLDIAAFTSSSANVQPIVSPDAPSNHIRFDVHLTSAPQLNFQNAYAKLAGDVDLHLRGTLASPSLLGRISLTEGSTSIGGTRYELQRGDIFFNNPVRIQPNIDIDATARVEDYDITLGLHGTPENIKVSYRSEPPLPEADVIALLALGRTQDEQSVYAGQQQQSAGDNPTTNALLGGALNATVSNRVQRLFGTGAIKVDPNFIGSLGNSTARVTVVEQVGQNLTFTYASNVNTTTQQLIQAEIAINRHVSILLTQD